MTRALLLVSTALWGCGEAIAASDAVTEDAHVDEPRADAVVDAWQPVDADTDAGLTLDGACTVLEAALTPTPDGGDDGCAWTMPSAAVERTQDPCACWLVCPAGDAHACRPKVQTCGDGFRDGEKPGDVVLCPNTCDAFRDAGGAPLVRFGCCTHIC